jgi:hypothetical protein
MGIPIEALVIGFVIGFPASTAILSYEQMSRTLD